MHGFLQYYITVAPRRRTGGIMIKETLLKIETAIQKIHNIDHSDKQQLLELMVSLKSEISGLTQSHADHARSIAGFTEIAAHEATRKTKSPALLKLSLQALNSSAGEFEASHPKLVDTINDICILLARIGI